MLHFNTLHNKTLGLLKQLQANPNFSAMRLVGGTALALQIGHRKSIDLDLFGLLSMEPIELQQELHAYGTLAIRNAGKSIHQFTLNGIQLDIVQYDYPWLAPPVCQEEIRLASMPDIVAMKLAAITNRGTKKDFIDLAFLLKHYDLAQMLDFYRSKFTDGSPFLVIKSLVYFEDAQEDPMPFMLHPMTWDQARDTITKTVQQHCTNLE